MPLRNFNIEPYCKTMILKNCLTPQMLKLVIEIGEEKTIVRTDWSAGGIGQHLKEIEFDKSYF